MAYAIVTAIESQSFDRVIVSTDSPEYADIAKAYGAEVPFLRPSELATSHSPDVGWARHAVIELGLKDGVFCILRPTNPFRTADMINRALLAFEHRPLVLAPGLYPRWPFVPSDAMRAVELCTQHPGKMWNLDGAAMRPMLDWPAENGLPLHSQPVQCAPPVFAQNGSIDIGLIANVATKTAKAACLGTSWLAFQTYDYEGFDLNTELDWLLAEHLVNTGLVTLPRLELKGE